METYSKMHDAMLDYINLYYRTNSSRRVAYKAELELTGESPLLILVDFYKALDTVLAEVKANMLSREDEYLVRAGSLLRYQLKDFILVITPTLVKLSKLAFSITASALPKEGGSELRAPELLFPKYLILDVLERSCTLDQAIVQLKSSLQTWSELAEHRAEAEAALVELEVIELMRGL